jgi:hypothetical protein
MLSGDLAVLQAPMLVSLAFDPFALFDDGFGPAKVGIGWCHVVEALVIAPVVVMLDEGADLSLQVVGQEVIFQEDAVLLCLVPALDLALGLGVHRGAPDMANPLGLDIVRQLPRDVAGAIVAEQPRFLAHMDLIAS